MNFNPLGPEGVKARMFEIQSKMDQCMMVPKQSEISQSHLFQSILDSEIGSNGKASFNSLSPLKEGLNQEMFGFIGGIDPSLAKVKPLSPFANESSLVLSHPLQKYLPILKRAAAEYSLDPELFQSMISVGSSFRPDARSPLGALGLSQLMPETVALLGIQDPFDPEQSLFGGANHFSRLLSQFPQKEHALAAYYAGPELVRKHAGIPPEGGARDYVEQVLSQYQLLQGKPTLSTHF